ncbi:biopolymer transporter ExbD [bacterium]|nr:biopolymer transporter ExbD [bacterium]
MDFFDTEQDGELSFEVNVISLIDILFLLIIFFAITTTFDSTKGIKVNLPQAKSAQIAESKAPISVTLAPSGESSIDGKLIAPEELLPTLTAFAPKDLIIIRADQAVNHGRVVGLMETAKQAGFEKIAFATKE